MTREAAHLRLGRGLAYVPQGRIVIPEMSVRDNLELGAHILGGDRTRIAHAIERLVALFPILGPGCASRPAPCPVASSRCSPSPVR